MSYNGYMFDNIGQKNNYDKLDAQYLKDVEIIDSKGLKREVGKVNYLAIPRELLIDVMDKSIFPYYFKDNANELIDAVPELEESEMYPNKFRKCFQMDLGDLFSLIKEFIRDIDDDKVYDNFIHILDLTTEIAYIDQKNDEYGISAQDNIDHNHVGEYYFIINKPIPFILIQKMQDEVSYRKRKEKMKLIRKADKVYNTEELSELCKGI